MTKKQVLNDMEVYIKKIGKSIDDTELYELQLGYHSIYDTVSLVKNIYDNIEIINEYKLKFYEMLEPIHPYIIDDTLMDRYCELSEDVAKARKDKNVKELRNAIIELKNNIELVKSINVNTCTITPIYTDKIICADIPSKFIVELCFNHILSFVHITKQIELNDITQLASNIMKTKLELIKDYYIM